MLSNACSIGKVINMLDVIRAGIDYGLDAGVRVFFVNLTSGNNGRDVWLSFLELIECIKDLDINFDWFAVETDEGNGVVHLLIRNCFLPVEWFSSKWSIIHGSFYVRKYEITVNDGIGIYLATQLNILNCDCSEGWLPVITKENKRSFLSSLDGFNKKLF